jgi:hypothetical protein
MSKSLTVMKLSSYIGLLLPIDEYLKLGLNSINLFCCVNFIPSTIKFKIVKSEIEKLT